ncbi:hypothetical protein FGB62_12g230 [Gracilaria domingensis]|nr:hypothetical protein FGB62_12g230 [Gracilaria domingensis]
MGTIAAARVFDGAVAERRCRPSGLRSDCNQPGVTVGLLQVDMRRCVSLGGLVEIEAGRAAQHLHTRSSEVGVVLLARSCTTLFVGNWRRERRFQTADRLAVRVQTSKACARRCNWALKHYKHTGSLGGNGWRVVVNKGTRRPVVVVEVVVVVVVVVVAAVVGCRRRGGSYVGGARVDVGGRGRVVRHADGGKTMVPRALGAIGAVERGVVRVGNAAHAKHVDGDRLAARDGVGHDRDARVVHLLGMHEHALDGEHALVAAGAAKMLLALVREQLLLLLEGAVTVVAEDAVARIGRGALLLATHAGGRGGGSAGDGGRPGGGGGGGGWSVWQSLRQRRQRSAMCSARARRRRGGARRALKLARSRARAAPRRAAYTRASNEQ